MKYCTKCLLPSTKPYIRFDEFGICNACLAHEKKQQAETGIDWDIRAHEFQKIVVNAKKRKALYYDVLVPVSGGKDSITQVHYLLNYDLKILAVNVDYGIKTNIGIYNLNRIPEMGANLLIYRPELNLHRKLIRIGFKDFGDPDLLSHTLLHAYPLHIALQLQIPLVLLGENSAFEYGGEESLSGLDTINREWFSKFAANQGHDARYISQKYDISMEKLIVYDYPDRIERENSTAIFCSQYFFWDSEKHFEIAKSYGFKPLPVPSEGTYRNYVGIDEKINRIHQYMKVLKFGYGRATDHACEDIRNGRITRQEAKKIVRKYDLVPLSDDYINDFIEFIGITKKDFFQVMESYRNKDLWEQDHNGTWYIPGHLEE